MDLESERSAVIKAITVKAGPERWLSEQTCLPHRPDESRKELESRMKGRYDGALR